MVTLICIRWHLRRLADNETHRSPKVREDQAKYLRAGFPDLLKSRHNTKTRIFALHIIINCRQFGVLSGAYEKKAFHFLYIIQNKI